MKCSSKNHKQYQFLLHKVYHSPHRHAYISYAIIVGFKDFLIYFFASYINNLNLKIKQDLDKPTASIPVSLFAWFGSICESPLPPTRKNLRQFLIKVWQCCFFFREFCFVQCLHSKRGPPMPFPPSTPPFAQPIAVMECFTYQFRDNFPYLIFCRSQSSTCSFLISRLGK